jgi:hypothetical protein
MQSLEEQQTLSDFPAFQPLVLRFSTQHRAMDLRTMPLEALLASLSVAEETHVHTEGPFPFPSPSVSEEEQAPLPPRTRWGLKQKAIRKLSDPQPRRGKGR